MPEVPDQESRSQTAVWMVEDNDLFCQTLARLIDEQPDMSCELAVPTCEEALEALESGRVPDIVLLDIGLPGMSGVEGVGRIRELSPETAVLMLTVHEDRDVVFEAIRSGASGYLLKSTSEEGVLDAIRDVQRGGAPLTPLIARRILDFFGHADERRSEYGLTDRETEILELMVEGLTMKELADDLHLSVHTIDTHFRNIYAKLHVRSRTEAVAKALKERLL